MIKHITNAMLVCLLSTSLLMAQDPKQKSQQAPINIVARAARYIPGISKIVVGAIGSVAIHLGLKELFQATSYADYIKGFGEFLSSDRLSNKQKLYGAAGALTPTITGLWLIKLGVQDCINEYNNNNKEN